MRHLTWFSVDNDDTHDLGQLSVAESLRAGAVRLLVAAADVDRPVRQCGAVTDHASVNTRSVHAAAGISPFCPRCGYLPSLNEGQERLAVVSDMRVAADGTVAESHVYRALVLNHAELGLETQLCLHDTVASKLRLWRQPAVRLCQYHRGAACVQGRTTG